MLQPRLGLCLTCTPERSQRADPQRTLPQEAALIPAVAATRLPPMARGRLRPGGALAWLFTHLLFLGACVLAASFVPAARTAAPQLAVLHARALEGWALVAPGGAWHPAAFIEHKGHLVVEASLLVVITFLLLQGTFRPGTNSEEAPLTEKVGAGQGAAGSQAVGGGWRRRRPRPGAASLATTPCPQRPSNPYTRTNSVHPSVHPAIPHSQEIDELCEEWEPEPLYPSLPQPQAAWKEPVISSQTGTQARRRRAGQGGGARRAACGAGTAAACHPPTARPVAVVLRR